MKRRKYVRIEESVLSNLKQVEYGRGYQAAKMETETERVKRKEARQLEEDRYRSQSIDAICHAVTALARLVDGRDAR